ncbi:MAG: VPLPA-CTERM sorting domain-containing protein [Pseudomonadota bacterium]
MKTWIIGAIALTASLWLPTTPATAATITLSGTAEADGAIPDFGLSRGDVFTYSIEIDGSVPDSGGDGSVLARFVEPIRSITIAGIDVGDPGNNVVVFGQDLVSLGGAIGDFDSLIFEFFLQSNWLVADSFELDQLTLLPDVFSEGFLVLSADDGSVLNEVLSVAVEREVPAVPLPAAGWMLLGGLGLLAAAGRRRTGRQTARGPAPRSLPDRRCQRPPSGPDTRTPPTACLAPRGAL